MHSIALAVSESDLERCLPVLLELRPHLKPHDFVKKIRRQEQSGFRLAYLELDGQIKAVAGYRILENLAWGKFLYVDDLVTKRTEIGGGYGSALLDWLLRQAKTQGCDEFHLDSGVQRYDAHRFYLHKFMAITAHHFALKL